MIGMTQESLASESNHTYQVWFERYLRKVDFEKQILNSARRGYLRYGMRVGYASAEYDRDALMKVDSRFIESLKVKYPDLKFKREPIKNLFSKEIGYNLTISWDGE